MTPRACPEQATTAQWRADRTSQDVASATVHAVLRAGIRDFDTAPLYTDSEDKLGHALLT